MPTTGLPTKRLNYTYSTVFLVNQKLLKVCGPGKSTCWLKWHLTVHSQTRTKPPQWVSRNWLNLACDWLNPEMQNSFHYSNISYLKVKLSWENLKRLTSRAYIPICRQFNVLKQANVFKPFKQVAKSKN